MHHLQLKKKEEEACNHHALPMFWYQTLQYESIESQIQIHLGPLLCPNLSKISNKRSWLTQETGQMRKTSDLGGGLLVICLFVCLSRICVQSLVHILNILKLWNPFPYSFPKQMPKYINLTALQEWWSFEWPVCSPNPPQ